MREPTINTDLPPNADAAGSGYPLGERVLTLRAVNDKQDSKVECSVHDANGRQLAFIRPSAPIPPAMRAIADLSFVITGADDSPLLWLTRSGGLSAHTLQARDPAGRELGCLRQTGSAFGTRLSMALESDGRQLGTVELVPSRRKRATVHEPIHDSSGTAIAYVDRRWRPRTGARNPQFDYTLDCTAPTLHPLPTLALVAAFAHYMYDRLYMGGPLGGHRIPSPLN